MRFVPSLAAAGVIVIGVVTACGGDDDTDDAYASNATANSTAGGGERPQVVVTTTILGDMVAEVLGEQAEVEVIMPLGSDPHDFAASARQAEAMEQADLLVVNGAGFEEGLLDLIESAEESGAPVFTFADHVDLLEFAGEHDGHAEDDEQAEGSGDPHIWTDPSKMATAVVAFAERAAEIDRVDAGAVESQGATYAEELTTLDSEIEDGLAGLAADRRVLVTNHEVFAYFADRYDFELVGAVIPSLTTNASASAADIEELAAVITQRGVPAVFGETTQPTQLADALASEVGGDVEVVELFTESLGEDGSGAETYIGLMRLNAELIGAALA